MSEADINKIAENITEDEFDAVGAPPSENVERLLIAQDGVSVTDANGETRKIFPKNIVFMLPNGKLIGLEDVLNAAGF